MSNETQESMKAGAVTERPHSVTVLGIHFIAVGVLGLVYHAREFMLRKSFGDDAVWVLLIRFLAIMGGVFLLRGPNWARWLLVVRLAYHVL
jgi:hypothetical protein